MMSQSYSISIEGLNNVVPKWSNRSSKVGYFSVLIEPMVRHSGLSNILINIRTYFKAMWHIDNQNYLSVHYKESKQAGTHQFSSPKVSDRNFTKVLLHQIFMLYGRQPDIILTCLPYCAILNIILCRHAKLS